MSDYVSYDLINEIFERLPSKSLLRFRSLSKSWCSRIQSPDFIHRHALQSRKKTPKILIRHSIKYGREYIDMYTLHSEDQFVSSNPEWLDVSIPAVKFPMGMGNTPIGEVVGSCNGILCLFHDIRNTISLWNPSIRRVTTLPPAPNHAVRARLVGFGFDPSIDDYKIVRISRIRTFVCTLKTRVWCPIASPNPEFGHQESCACFFNGALHWTVTDNYHNNGYSHHILTFDLTTHVFGKIALPNPDWLAIELTIINSSLAVIPDNVFGYHPREGKGNRIWILKEENYVPFWSDPYKFGQSGLSFYPSQGMKSSLQLTTNGHILLNFASRDTYGVYNTRTGKWDPSMFMYFQDSKHKHMETYVESLELMIDTEQGLKKTNETDEIAIHNVTLRKSEMSMFFSYVRLFWFSIRSCILPS